MSSVPVSLAEEGGPARRRSVLGWRIVLGLYAGALATGTHWPQLQVGDPQHPADKLLHFTAFGGLALVLWQARYFRRVISLFLVTLAWTALDELSQAVPGIGRSVSYEDVVAGTMGNLCTCLLLWATRPLPHAVARLRRQRFDSMIDLILSRPIGWLGLVLSAAAGVTVALPGAVIINGFSAEPTPFQAGVVGLVFGSGLGAAAFLLMAMQSLEARMMERRLCLGCGAPVPTPVATSSTTEPERCPACQQTPLVAQWLPMPGVTTGAILRACLPPVLGGMATILLGFIVIQGYAALMPASDLVLRVNAFWNGLSKGMDTDINATCLCAVLAVTIERCRVRLARRLDEGHRVCLGCGHDLRSTPAADGTGRCGECGAGFVRIGR